MTRRGPRSPMLGYILQRSLLMVPTLVGITVISFFIMHLAPGDPVDLFLGGVAGGEGLASDRQQDIEKTREDLRRQLGLDRPVHVQYFNWVTALFLKVGNHQRIRPERVAGGRVAGTARGGGTQGAPGTRKGGTERTVPCPCARSRARGSERA